MSQWNQGGQYPPDPNQVSEADKPGYPPQKSEYPTKGGYPPQLPQGDCPTAPPTEEYPPPSYSCATGFIQPPPLAGGAPDGGHVPFSGNCDFTSDNGADKVIDFNDQTIRRGFIKMVFFVLSVQLAAILMIIFWFFYHTSMNFYVKDYVHIFIVSLIVLMVTLIATAFCDKLRRRSPTKYYFLVILTLALSFCLGCSAATYNANSIPMTVGITLVFCMGVTLFVFLTKYNFTLITGIYLMGFLIFVVLLSFFIIGIDMMVPLTCAIFAFLLFSLYLVYGTQVMMGGKYGSHMYAISHEEYIFAVLNLYVDGINIFRHLWNTLNKIN